MREIDAEDMYPREAARLDAVLHSWKIIKFSVIETAKNNAGPNGNEDGYQILTWVATMMGQQEAKWNG